MSGFDAEAALVGAAALMATLPELQEVRIGAPEALSSQVEGWVAIGDPDNIGAAASGGLYELPLNLLFWFGYSVEGSEESAERKLADYMTDLTRRLIRNRLGTVDGVTANLNGSVDRMGLPSPAAGLSEYTMMAGQEARIYPLAVRIVQREVITSA